MKPLMKYSVRINTTGNTLFIKGTEKPINKPAARWTIAKHPETGSHVEFVCSLTTVSNLTLGWVIRKMCERENNNISFVLDSDGQLKVVNHDGE